VTTIQEKLERLQNLAYCQIPRQLYTTDQVAIAWAWQRLKELEGVSVRERFRANLLDVLEECDGSESKAARLLGIAVTTLRRALNPEYQTPKDRGLGTVRRGAKPGWGKPEPPEPEAKGEDDQGS
jgi:DNA-binding NtrC family response regulator